ncbi:MAG: uroporphyrinogen-III synthase [Neptuniibacter sp.]
MPDTLNGLRVLVTRPAHQSEELLSQLKQEGAVATPFPLLQISPIDEGHSTFHQIKQYILDLDLYQHVIFISPNAAFYGGEWIDQYWPQLPVKVNWYAIGNKTAQVLNNYGIDASQSPLGYDSEALLTLPELQQVKGEKVLIIRGAGGRAKLADELSARGAQVSYAELYMRDCPNYKNIDIVQSLTPTPDAILISSGEALQNLEQLVQQAELSTDSLKSCHIIVPSDRVKNTARAMGFKRITTASGPDNQAMMDTLKQ